MVRGSQSRPLTKCGVGWLLEIQTSLTSERNQKGEKLMAVQNYEEMKHDDHWKETWENAHVKLDKMFAENRMTQRVHTIIGDEHGIDSVDDAKKVLKFVYSHHPTDEEKICTTLLVFEALMAWHELNEHSGISK
jgi:hypothetical protein